MFTIVSLLAIFIALATIGDGDGNKDHVSSGIFIAFSLLVPLALIAIGMVLA